MLETNSSETSFHLSETASYSYLARLATKAILVLVIIMTFSMVQIFRHESSARLIFLLVGSLVSGIMLFAFGILVLIDRGRKRRGVIPMLISLGGFVPYVFGCYLCFYEGFWRLKGLFSNLSISIIVISILFIVAGYLVVYGTYEVSEFARKIDRGLIIIDDDK